MNNQDGRPSETADHSSRAPTLDDESNVTGNREKHSSLIDVAMTTDAKNLGNVQDENPTMIINGKRKPNFRIPLSPAQIYYGMEKSHDVSQEGKFMYVYRVSVSMDLHKHTNTRVDLIQILKDIFRNIIAVDPTAMLVPVRN